MAANGDVLTSLVGRQRKRLVATILGAAERDIRGDLSPQQWEALRSKVLDSAAIFGDFVLDLVRAANEGSWVNDEAMRVLYAINNGVKDLLDEDLEPEES